jgi:hypothetical protein
MARKKALKVGDEVVVINGRRWIAPPARTSVVTAVSARQVEIKGNIGFVNKSAVVRRSPTAERLGLRLDLLAKLEDEEMEKLRAANIPIRDRYAKAIDPIRKEIRELYRDVENEQ